MKSVIIMVIFSLVYMVGMQIFNTNKESVKLESNSNINISESNKYSVSIEGAVNKPGSYTLNKGDKLSTLISLAGGVKPQADNKAYNLSSILKNGVTYYIPFKTNNKEKVSINEASLATLDSLPGIGSVLASRIISYRNKFGPFLAIEDLKQVSGIGNSLFDQIKDLISL